MHQTLVFHWSESVLYRRGYVRQEIDGTGWQQSQFPAYDLDDLAITPVLNEQNESVRVTVPIENTDCVCQLWQVNVKRVTLYLIDTDIDENPSHLRELTAQLYGGDNECDSAGAVLVGGVRALDALGITRLFFI